MKTWYAIEGLFVGLIGRPTLALVKHLRVVFLLAGFAFTTQVVYRPSSGTEQTSRTVAPVIIGLILFSVGAAVRRYDEIVAIVRAAEDMDERIGLRRSG